MTTPLLESSLTPSEVVLQLTQNAPVDLDRVAGELGLAVRYDPTLPDSVSGKIERTGDHYLITVNAKHAARRQRFTLAHEIGHFVLHRDLFGRGLTDDALYRSTLHDGSQFGDGRETEANRYAADLLMPARVLRAEWRSGNQSLAGVASAFDVSTQAARIRLEELGLGA